MFANLDNNTLLLIIAVVLVFLYLTMDSKENMKSISADKKKGGISSRAAGRVSDKKVGEDVAPVVEGYMNGYY